MNYYNWPLSPWPGIPGASHISNNYENTKLTLYSGVRTRPNCKEAGSVDQLQRTFKGLDVHIEFTEDYGMVITGSEDHNVRGSRVT